MPGPDTLMQLHYEGRLLGSMPFISTFSEGKPVFLNFNKLSSCWQESLSVMGKGGKAIVYCPPSVYKGAELNTLDSNNIKALETLQLQHILELLDVLQ